MAGDRPALRSGAPLQKERYRYSGGGGILGGDDGDRDVHYTCDAADNRTRREVFRFSERADYSYNELNQLNHWRARGGLRG